MPHPPLPLSFRAELVKPLLADLRAGECCSLIGTSGTGKSNLARFLQRHDVQRMYWNDERTWIIAIDSHGLILSDGQKAEYEVAELMVRSVIEEAERRSFSTEFLTWANELHHRLIQQSNTFFALRTLQDLCKRLCEKDNLHFIFVFDQFEDLWLRLDTRFFLNLRKLRDQFKYQFVYLVMTRDRLQRMHKDPQTVEAFWELFSAHTYSLGPYSESDATTMLERLILRADITKADIHPELIGLSGRHPGLLRAIFWALRASPHTPVSEKELLKISSICEECQKIWNTLSPAEQRLCHVIARNLPLHQSAAETLHELHFKGILSGDPSVLFSPLFAAYVLQKTENKVFGIVVDVRLRQVWLDGQLLQKPLTRLEFELLEHLALHSETVCKHEDMLHTLYPNEPYHGKHDQRLYAILARLRAALGEDARNPRYLITHRGGGIQLVQGEIINAEP